MTHLELWVKLGSGRLTALANELECSISNAFQLISSEKNKDPKRLENAINNVEGREKKQKRCCKNNVLKSASLVSHHEEWVKKKAQFELIRWSEFYASHR